MKFRQCRDLDLVEGLEFACFGSSVKYVRSQGGNATWWVGWDGDRPVAFCGAKLLDDGVLYLCLTGVIQDARGRRLQRRMIRLRESWGRARGAETSLTYTHIGNHASSNNLAACGYRLYDPEHAWAGRTGWLYWRKPLQKKRARKR